MFSLSISFFFFFPLLSFKIVWHLLPFFFLIIIIIITLTKLVWAEFSVRQFREVGEERLEGVNRFLQVLRECNLRYNIKWPLNREMLFSRLVNSYVAKQRIGFTFTVIRWDLDFEKQSSRLECYDVCLFTPFLSRYLGV